MPLTAVDPGAWGAWGPWGAAAGVAALLLGLEALERLAERRRRARRERRPSPFSYRTETAHGTPLVDRPGAIVLKLHPYLVCRAEPGQRSEGLTINAQGYRGRDWSRTRRPGTRRVLVLGDSMTFGFGVGDDEVFPARLERRLAEALPDGPPIEVLNGAGLGWNSTQQLVALVTELLDHEPDAVVVFGGVSDLTAGRLTPHEGAPVNPAFTQVERIVDGAAAPGALAALRALARRSALGRGLERRLRRLLRGLASGDEATVYDAVPLVDPRPGIARYRLNVERACLAARARGATAVVASAPELFQRREPVPEAERALRARKGRGGYEAIARDVYPLFARAAGEAARAAGASYVDLSRAFDDAFGPAFHDWAHLNGAGHDIVARRLAPVVAEALGLEVAATAAAAREGAP